MTDAPSTESTSVKRWRQWGARGLVIARRACTNAGGWTQKHWRHLVAALQEPELAAAPGSSPPIAGRLTQRRDASGPIVVPARGYVFNFNVRATFTWSSNGLRPELLSSYAHYFMPHAIQRLARLAADRARTFAPHQAGELEVELQRVLAEQGPWHYDRGEVVVTCQPDAWVRLDERVKQALQPYWEDLVKLECQYEVHMRRAQYAEQLNRRWVTILEDFVDNPIDDDATQATNEYLANARQHMMAEQKAAAQWSKDLISERRRNLDFLKPFSSFDILPEGSQGQAHETSERLGDPTAAGSEGSARDSGSPVQG